ncbi:MAG TPA: TolC family protein [Nostocaceae cyanobacterium]|nr:TolC family protein [Nostocaceae cyanobacterium]
MNGYCCKIPTLALLLILLFPNLGNCQEVIKSPINNYQPTEDSADNFKTLLSNSSEELRLNLADAVYLALQNNRDLKVSYLQRILDKKQLAETESQFNPTFTPQIALNFTNNQNGYNQSNNTTASLNANLNWKIPTGGNITLTWQGQNQLLQNNSLNIYSDTNTLSQSINLNLSQPLLRGSGTGYNSINIQKARLTEKANLLNFTNTISQTITNTILTYRSLLLAQERLKIEEFSVENAKKDLERLQALFDFGRIPRNNLVERQADIAQQEVNLVNTRGELEQAITNLLKILDLPVRKKLVAIETPIPPASLNLPGFEEMLELALTNNSGYLNALNAVENAKFNITEAENQQQFDLRLNLGYSFNSAGNTSDTSNLTSSLTLSREFGNYSQDNAVARSKINLQTANIALDKSRENLKEELKTKVRNAENTFQQIKLAQQARKLAETKLVNARERMRLGSNISMTDIIAFEKSVVDAKNQELNAIINHLNSITELEQFLGITLNKWVK